jgi:hypothetical protein
MGLSRLTLLGFGILAWSGAVALASLSFGSLEASRAGAIVAVLGATGGLATSIVGAARHDD